MNKLTAFFAFIVGLFAILSIVKTPSVSSASAPTNSAAQQFENFFLGIGRATARLAVKADLAIARLFGFRSVSYGLGITEGADAQILKSLEGLNEKIGRISEVEKAAQKQQADLEQVTKLVAEVKAEMDAVRRAQIALKSQAPRRKGEVSDDCAAFLGAVYLRAAVVQERLQGKSLDAAESHIKNILGKTALSSSDIPLPVGYSGEVVELVSQHGAARRYGTVLPLGNGVVKLPKLKTDPAFGLVAVSSGGAEKSPQTEWATFTAEKFGGLVRLPSEIEEDSVVQMGQFLARYGARGMAYIEDYNFFRSTGAGSGANGTAEGLTKSVVTDSKTVAHASTKTAISDMTLAKIRELRSKVDAAALGTSAYYFHPSIEQALSGLNTAGDKPYIANGIQGASLDGFPIRWVDVLPAYSTSASASTVYGLFGDLSYTYLGVRGVMRADISREAGFTTDEVLVRFLERFTVQKMATGSVAGIITAAS